jgi:hypothetical protein
LQHREVLDRRPGRFRWLQKNVREDAVLYFETIADLLEERLLSSIENREAFFLDGLNAKFAR